MRDPPTGSEQKKYQRSKSDQEQVKSSCSVTNRTGPSSKVRSERGPIFDVLDLMSRLYPLGKYRFDQDLFFRSTKSEHDVIMNIKT